jgi:glycosyltransferase involved in cell wall biosynthesis
MNYEIITVIIPTYKPEDYICECLLSVKNQDIGEQNYNVVIVLNGEKEPYYSEISNYIKEFHNFQIYYISEKGVSNARNYALDMVNTGYVVFVDDDDTISSNYLSGLFKKIDESSIVVSNEYVRHTDLSIKKGYISANFEKLVNKRKTLVSCRSYFSTACFKMIPVNIIENRRFDTRFANGEDALFMALISDKIKSIEFAEKNVVYYRRIRKNSASCKRISFFRKLKNAVNLLRSFGKIYLSHPLKYNMCFFTTRFMAVIKEFLYYYLKHNRVN